MTTEWPTFDELKNIAEQNPEQLEAFRQREVEAIIAKAPPEMRHRLRGLQFQIDCKRRLAGTPMASCIAISKMMHESVAKLNGVLNGKPEIITEKQEDHANSVIRFPITG